MTDGNEPGYSSARGTILTGGIALIAGAFAFLAVFAYLAAQFNYPDVLDGNARDVLPALLATGSAGRAAWALYAVLPLIFLPACVSAVLGGFSFSVFFVLSGVGLRRHARAPSWLAWWGIGTGVLGIQ